MFWITDPGDPPMPPWRPKVADPGDPPDPPWKPGGG